MAALVTPTEVKAILDNCTLGDEIINAYINAATEVVAQTFSGDTDIGDTLKKEIERWFAAHMIASTRHRSTSNESVGGASVTYTGQWGQGLASTPYGQMVLQLDTTGKFASMGKRGVNVQAIESFD